MLIGFFNNTMILFGIIFVFSMVLCGILGEKSKYINFCGTIFLGSLVLSGISVIIIIGCMIYYTFIGPNYDKINSRIYEIQLIENEVYNKAHPNNNDYENLVDAINKYNKVIDSYYITYQNLVIEFPEKLTTYQKAVFDFETNSVMWEDISDFE